MYVPKHGHGRASAHPALMEKNPARRAFFREWRKHRHLTLEQLADRIGMTHASVSRIERSLQKWDQDFLEKVADALMCEPVDLLVRNPEDPDGIWSLWDRAKPGTRQQIVEIAKTLLKTAS